MPEVHHDFVATELWMHCNAALWDEAPVMRGAELVCSSASWESKEIVELGIRVASDQGVVYLFPIPVAGSSLGRPWSDVECRNARVWARHVVAWIQEAVDERFPSWAAFDPGAPYRRVYIGSAGLMHR
jgi:hypothetical protein